MAESGGNKKTSSKLQKEHYKRYQLENRVQKNKIKGLVRHCKKFTQDLMASKRLAELKKDGGYKPRSKPISPGSNPPDNYVMDSFIDIVFPKTPGEQLSELLGIPLKTPRPKQKGKTAFRYKKNKKT